MQQIFWLVVYLPLWKKWKSMGGIIPYMKWKITYMFQTTNQYFCAKTMSWQMAARLHSSSSEISGWDRLGRIFFFVHPSKVHQNTEMQQNRKIKAHLIFIIINIMIFIIIIIMISYLILLRLLILQMCLSPASHIPFFPICPAVFHTAHRNSALVPRRISDLRFHLGEPPIPDI